MFPTHAGMIPSYTIVISSRKGVPRTCGDDPSDLNFGSIFMHVFPAHAGMIHVMGVVRSVGSMCSPHMRG